MSRSSSVPVLGLAIAAALALVACKGQGGNDTLADGATDSDSAATGATSTGPGAPPVGSASPAAGNDASQAATPITGAATSPTLMLAANGAYVTNGGGGALYWVEGDMDGSKCAGACTQAWPPVTADAQQPTGAAGLQGASISTVSRADGMRQVTFEGHPLYRYAADAGVGQANGDGVKDKFGSWHVAKPSAAPASGATTPASTMPAGESKSGG